MKVVYSEHFQAELCCITGRYSAEGKELGRRFVQTVESACLEINMPSPFFAKTGWSRRFRKPAD